ncbi:MAG: hypothetical protein RLZZ117_1654 [Cyanobacteriota bacterium]|jgi:hypothetical protein
MAYTSQDLANLRQAIGEGVQRVKFSDGRELTYRTLDEMRRIEASMAAELEPTENVTLKRHYFTPKRI